MGSKTSNGAQHHVEVVWPQIFATFGVGNCYDAIDIGIFIRVETLCQCLSKTGGSRGGADSGNVVTGSNAAATRSQEAAKITICGRSRNLLVGFKIDSIERWNVVVKIGAGR